MNDPETYLSWDDNGIRVLCEREECMVERGGKRWWWEGDTLPYKLTAKIAADAITAHVATHGPRCPEGCSLAPWVPCEHGYRYITQVVHSVKSSTLATTQP